MLVDLAAAATQPFEPTRAHRALGSFVGPWTGTAFTWLDPGGEAQTADLYAEGELILGGRFLVLRYASTRDGKPHAGQFLIGYHVQDHRWEAVWVDSAHTGTEVMPCVGPFVEDGPVRFHGTHPGEPGGPRWGWRTTLAVDPEGVLILDAENVHPDGTEDRAWAWRLGRAGGLGTRAAGAAYPGRTS